MSKFVLAGAISALMISSSFAADMVSIPSTYDSSNVNWDGFYAGMGTAVATISDGVRSFDIIGAEMSIGANITSEDFLFGAEVALGVWSDTQPAIMLGYKPELVI